MDKKAVFLDDTDVPEIVWEKACVAFSAIKKEREAELMEENKLSVKSTMNAADNQSESGRKVRNGWKTRKYVKTVAAVAACAAVAITVSVRTGTWSPAAGDQDVVVHETSGKENADKGDAGVSAVEKKFTLQIRAAEYQGEQPVELSIGHPVPVITDGWSRGWGLSGNADGEISYCINMPFTCAGNDIQKITYRINNGAFQIVQPVGESILTDAERYVGSDGESDMNCGSVGGENEAEDVPSKEFETGYYKSITLSYGKQTAEDTWINICNRISDSEDILDLIWGEGHSVQDENKGIQKMLADTVITCTVQYTDGTSQSVDIKPGSQVMTDAQASGQEVETVDPDEERVNITFELQ